MNSLPRFSPLSTSSLVSPRKVLLIATRQIGDVLLATPLLRSLRMAWPEAQIDVLVFQRMGGMLEGNPDLNEIIEIAERPNWKMNWQLLKRIGRQYDLSVSTLPGDRPNIYGFLAASLRVSLIPDLTGQGRWKRWINAGWALLDNVHTHTVEQNLMLARVLQLETVHTLVPPQADDAEEQVVRMLGFNPSQQPCIVLHPFPMWRYKRWNEAGWEALLETCQQAGVRTVLTGGPDAEERQFCHGLAKKFIGVVDSSGRFRFSELSWLLRQAQAYVGPDTAVTHLAAACGTRTLALYGPSNPVKWGPWPQNYADAQPPFQMYSPQPQKRGNVILLQPNYAKGCVPCREEGCERHKGSYSACMDQLSAERVITALKQMAPDLLA